MFDEKTYIEREGKLKDGYIRAAAMTPKIKVADCEYNIETVSYTHLTLPTTPYV